MMFYTNMKYIALEIQPEDGIKHFKKVTLLGQRKSLHCVVYSQSYVKPTVYISKIETKHYFQIKKLFNSSVFFKYIVNKVNSKYESI